MGNYSFTLSSDPLNTKEKDLFKGHLESLELNNTIWNLFESLFQTTSRDTVPLMLRMSSGDELVAAVVMIKCFNYGITLTRLKPLINLIQLFRFPVHVWMRAGIAPELMANPGFVNDKYDSAEIYPILMEHIQRKLFLSFVHDLKDNSHLYPSGIKLDYPDEGVIDMEDVVSEENYRRLHKNIKKKIRHFRSKGGMVEIITGRLSDEDVQMVGQSIESTSKHSIFKLPYQEIYPAMCMASATIEDENVVHFICRTETLFLGYHSFLDFGTHLRCLNGAFNRELKTTHHAYENMIMKVVAYADERKIKRIYFGPVLNETKSRMMHEFLSTRIHFSSSNPILKAVFPPILKNSRMANKSVMRFSSRNGG